MLRPALTVRIQRNYIKLYGVRWLATKWEKKGNV
jgi:uncharacterized membrane protein